MENLTQYPWLIFAATFVALWLASVTGSWLRRRNPSAGDEQHEDLGVILGATLTLLALIIGFSISMATSRYDQRKNLEEAEANAIGTEILRADLLPPADAANVREPSWRLPRPAHPVLHQSRTTLGERRSINRPANYRPISGLRFADRLPHSQLRLRRWCSPA